MNSSELKTVFSSPPGTCAQPGSCVPIIKADILGLCRCGLFLAFLGHAWQLTHRAEERVIPQLCDNIFGQTVHLFIYAHR